MIKSLFSITFALFFINLMSIITTLYMGRYLSIQDFGSFALLKTFILIGTTFSLFGLDHYRITNKIKKNYNNEHASLICIFFLLSLIFVIFISIIYHLSIKYIFTLWLIIFANCNIIYLSASFRSKLNFVISKICVA